MTAPAPHSPGQTADGSPTSLVRTAIWVAIGALIAAAVVCVVWVLIGSANGLIGRAFLTILLLAAFAGVAILDAHLAPRRPAWFALTSMVVWVVTLLIGAFMIWMPEPLGYWSFGPGRFFSFLLIVLILQLAVLHVRLYAKAFSRHVTAFTRGVAYTTMALVAILAIMLVLPLMLYEYVDFGDVYWRIVVAVTILAAVGTALIPLMNVLFAPKTPRAPQPGPYAPVAWPTYVDGVTPLPVLPDGSPDWNAYYTGYPSTVAQAIAPVPAYPVAPAPEWTAPPTPEQGAAPAPAYAAPTEQATPAQVVPEQAAPGPVVPPQAPAEWAPPSAPPPAGYQGYPPPPPLPPHQ